METVETNQKIYSTYVNLYKCNYCAFIEFNVKQQSRSQQHLFTYLAKTAKTDTFYKLVFSPQPTPLRPNYHNHSIIKRRPKQNNTNFYSHTTLTCILYQLRTQRNYQSDLLGKCSEYLPQYQIMLYISLDRRYTVVYMWLPNTFFFLSKFKCLNELLGAMLVGSVSFTNIKVGRAKNQWS